MENMKDDFDDKLVKHSEKILTELRLDSDKLIEIETDMRELRPVHKKI